MNGMNRWVLIVLSVLLCYPLAGEIEGWSTIDVKVNLPGRFSLLAGAELRHEKPVFTRRYLQNWQAGLMFRLLKHVHVGLGYKREVVLNKQLDIGEDRFLLMAVWKPPLSKETSLEFRFLAERRRFEERLGQNHYRFRLRVRFLWRVAVWKVKLIPYVYVEPFFQTIDNEISRHRFSTGFSIPIRGTLALTFGILREDRKYHDIRHAVLSGLHIEL